MIRELCHKEISLRADDRDNTALHVSDLSDCSRAVWAKRNGQALEPFNDDTRRKFDMGIDLEERVGRALDLLEDYVIVRQYEHHLGVAIGHSDFICRHKTNPKHSFVVEVKSTTFYPKLVNGKRFRVPPKKDEVQWHYRLQAAAYALEQKFTKFVLVIICRESGMLAEHWYDTKDYEDAILAALDEKTGLTAVGDPMPAAEPPAYAYNAKGKNWRCSYCTFSTCEKNENPAALDMIEVAA